MPTYWEPRNRHRFPPDYNWLLYWRISLALAILFVSAVGFLSAQADVTREAVAGRAFEIRTPQPWPVLGVAMALLLSLPACGVVYLLVNRPREGVRAAMMHDAFHVVLLAIGAIGLVANQPLSPGFEGHILVAVAVTALLAAEALWLGARTRRVWVGSGIVLGYVACAGAVIVSTYVPGFTS